MAQGFVSSIALTGCAALIEELGGNPQALAARIAIPPEALRGPEVLLTGEQVNGLFELAATVLKTRDFGLQLAQRQGAHLLSPLWVLARTAGTVRAALTEVVTAFDFYVTTAVLRLIEEPQGALAISFDMRISGESSLVQVVELSFAIICQELQKMLGAAWRPAAVQFRHAGPRDIRTHRALFGDMVLFNQDRNAILVDGPSASKPLRSASRRLNQAMRRDLDSRRALTRRDTAERADLTLRALLPSGRFDLAAVAAEMGLAPRTLQARLTDEGTSFQHLADKARLDMARRYILDSDLQMTEIADLLRFSGVSAFSRFVKQQTGRSPRQIRSDRTAGRGAQTPP
jgi:AraC-like DNA-binding protein